MLALLASEERDRLGVVADADEPVPEVGFLLVLREMEAHEPPADQHREQRAHRRVAEESRHQLRRDAPEHAEKCDQRDRGVDDDQQVAEDVRREEPHVLGDALVRVVDGDGAAQPVVDAVVEVPAQQVIRHPVAPGERQPVGRELVEGAHGDRERERGEVAPEVSPERGLVAL